MKKLIAVDLDGTLLRTNKTIAEATTRECGRLFREGAIFVAASGRGFHTLPDNVVCMPGIEYAITLNGAATYQMHPKALLCQSLIDARAVEQIIETTRGERGIFFEAFIDGYGYANMEYVKEPNRYGASRYSIEYIQQTREPVPDMRLFITKMKRRLSSIDIVVSDPEQKARIWENLREQVPDIYITTSSSHLIEISNVTSGKAHALEELATRLGIPQEDIIAIGDGDNDSEMLRYAGIGVAMENASEACKAAADVVTGSNDREGVAAFLKTIKK